MTASQVYKEVKNGIRSGIQFYSGQIDLAEDLFQHSKKLLEVRRQERSQLIKGFEHKDSLMNEKKLKMQLSQYEQPKPVYFIFLFFYLFLFIFFFKKKK